MAGPQAMMPGMMPPYGQQQNTGISPGPHSHLVCGGCQTLLMYPQSGASNVRCSRCSHITTIPSAAAQNADSSQIVCNGCRVLLSYPRGAQSVQCSLCSTITQVPVYGHVGCTGCSVTLMYPLGARSVKCSICHAVTNVANHSPWGTMPHSAPGGQQQQQQQVGGGNPQQPGMQPQQQPGMQPQQQPKPTTQTVVVENPTTLDAQGNEMTHIAVGVKETNA